jgi:glycerophosphoryl diester phosphodiesterase
MNRTNDPVFISTRMAACAAIFLCVALSTLFTAIGCSSSEVQEVSVMRVAHRGGSALAPENTLAAFSVGLQHDADALEMDVHLSKDGEIMVTHDPLLARTTGQPGEVADYDANTLGGFNAATAFIGSTSYGSQKVPTFDEVLDLVEREAKRPVVLQVEIKLKNDESRYLGIEEKLIAKLRERGRIESTIIISFDFPSLARIQELEPQIRTGALISKKYMTSVGAKGPKAVAENIASLKVDYVGINYQYLSQTLYNEFRNKKLGVGAWTVNEAKDMSRFAEMGVDFITSDRPDLLLQIVGLKN